MPPSPAAPPLPPAVDFDAAGRAVLAFLRRRLGFRLWMVTRTQGDDWIVLQSDDQGYGVEPGRVFRWADSFCARMVQGHGPRIAPDSERVAAYAAAPVAREIEIGAYIGVPLTHADGTLFGTLCAIDPAPQPPAIAAEQEMVELLASLLSALLQSHLALAEAVRQREKLAVDAQTDPMTGLFNRRAWDRLLAGEEERCRRYGHFAAVLIIDLDGLKRANDTLGHAAGDALIGRAAAALRAAARDNDVVARLGGDEFALLAVECDKTAAEHVVRRVRASLGAAGVDASVGAAVREPGRDLRDAASQADRLMYLEKRARAAGPPWPAVDAVPGGAPSSGRLAPPAPDAAAPSPDRPRMP